MKKNILIAIVAGLLLGGVIAAYIYWQSDQSKPKTVQQAMPLTVPPPEPAVQQVLETPPEKPVLPALLDSDKLMLDTLADLVGNKSLIKLFITKQVIQKIVATIDNLPRTRLSVNVVPVQRAQGKFITEGAEDRNIISPKNATRYDDYVKIAEMIDAQKLVAAYVRLYPLFQEAYVDLGYPKKYFNDRLLVVLNHLLAAPDLQEPVKIIRPKVFYLYADPSMEARSAGQKILMRIGSENEAKIKGKLREIKEQVMLHMHDRKADEAK